MGRLAGIFYVASGAIALSTLPLVSAGAHIAGMVTVTFIAITIGCVCLILPWDRWPRLATLALVPPAFALIAFYNLYQGAGLYTYGIFFVVTFVWIGVAHSRGTSLAMAPLATVAYVVPIYFLPGDVAMGITSAVVAIPACVMVGETLAWGAERLALAEQALHREREIAGQLKELDELKTTFLATISHELRTPITICRGHLEVLDPAAGPQEVRATAELVLDELDRMSRLVDDVTTMVRGGDPSFLHREAVPVNDLARQVAKKVEPPPERPAPDAGGPDRGERRGRSTPAATGPRQPPAQRRGPYARGRAGGVPGRRRRRVVDVRGPRRRARTRSG